MSPLLDTIKSAHIYVTQYARNQAMKQQRTGDHTYVMWHVNMEI